MNALYKCLLLYYTSITTAFQKHVQSIQSKISMKIDIRLQSDKSDEVNIGIGYQSYRRGHSYNRPNFLNLLLEFPTLQ